MFTYTIHRENKQDLQKSRLDLRYQNNTWQASILSSLEQAEDNSIM